MSTMTRFFLFLISVVCSSGVLAFVPNQAFQSSFAAATRRFSSSSSRRSSIQSLRLFGVSHRDALVMMPATIEREAVKVGGGPSILERPQVERKRRTEDPVKERKGSGDQAWEVRIYNDGLNTREHVARSLVQVTGMSEITAYQTMMQAHQNGIAVVGRWVYEVAEMYHDALRKNGIICDIVPVDEES